MSASPRAWAECLNRGSPLPVRVAKEGERPSAGTALLAGTNDHLTFKAADRIGYTAEPREHPYRPSVDVFFESLTQLAESIRRSVESLKIPHSASSTGPYVTLSIGAVATIPQNEAPLLELIVRADKAMYEAKSLGKNRVVGHE